MDGYGDFVGFTWRWIRIPVTPAKAGVQPWPWIPAYAGMTSSAMPIATLRVSPWLKFRPRRSDERGLLKMRLKGLLRS